MNCEHTPNCVLIQVESESQVNLLSNAGTAVSWITEFHLDDGIDDVSGWSLWGGFLPPLGEYRRRYFRFFRALWNESRVEGLMIIAALTIRMGSRNNDQKPSRARSWVERFGARSLALLWIINCCFKSRFSAITVRLPPGCISLAKVVSR